MCMARSLGSFAAPRGIHETPAWLSLVVSSLDIGLAGGGNGIAGSLPFPPLRSPSRRVVARIVTGPHDAHRQDLHLPMRYATGRRRSVIRLRISHQTEDVRTKKTGESTRQSRRGNEMSQPEPSAAELHCGIRTVPNSRSVVSFCSTSTATAWPPRCGPATCIAPTIGTTCSCRKLTGSRRRVRAWRSARTRRLPSRRSTTRSRRATWTMSSACRRTRAWSWKSKTSSFVRRDGRAASPWCATRVFATRRRVGPRPDGLWRWCADAGRPTRFKPSSPSPTDAVRDGSAKLGHPVQNVTREHGLTPLPR